MAEQVRSAPATTGVSTVRQSCRLCNSTQLEPVWSFGETPLANNYVTPEAVAANTFEPMAPLRVSYCHACHLVQLIDVVQPDLLFKHYLYVSSTSKSFVQHFAEYADHLLKRFTLTASDLVIDVGSNDGVLLRPLKEAGIRILGIDPAENLAAQATANGIPTEATYFTPEVAIRLRASYGSAKIITANNVFAHTDDIDQFVAAVKALLADDGVFVFEVQYLKDLIDKNLFDIVYHEHTNYYHLTPLVHYFERHAMKVIDVQHLPVHGGSIRVFVARSTATGTPTLTPTVAVAERLADEAAAGLNSVEPYKAMARRIATNKQSLRTILDHLRAEGKTIVGYGAPAKATTLMYAFGLTKKDIAYIVDDAPLKQGRVMPGTHIPIYGPEALYGEAPVPRRSADGGAMRGTPFDIAQAKPEYCLILAWNFAEPIMKQHERFVQQGGTWIIPVPEPRIVARP